MTARIFFSRGWRPRLSAMTLCMAAGLLPITIRRAAAQAVSPGDYPIRDRQPVDQTLPGQQLGTDLTLNQGVQSITAENESFNRYALGLEASGGVITNFFGTQKNQTNTSVAQFAAQAGLRFENERTSYFAIYQPAYNVYPEYSQVNSFAQRFYQDLTHQITEHTGVGWNMTAARYLSLNEYLPQSLNIGGIGVVSPTLGAALREDSFEITNVATSILYRHLMSTRMTFSGTLVSGYFLTVPGGTSSGSHTGFNERYITSGADLRLDYRLAPRDAIGVELTPIYIYSEDPSGHVTAETLQATYQRQLTATLQARVGAGPLFVQGSSPVYGSIRDTSYAVGASLSRQIRQSQFSIAFNRAFVVNLLSPAILSNGVNFNSYLPLKRNWILVGAATYVNDSGSGSLYGSADFYGAQAQLAYQLGHKMQLFARYSVISENFNREVAFQSYAFTRNQIGGGIRFNLGNPTTLGGVK